MRTTPAAIWFSRAGTAATMDAARAVSALTHRDLSAGEGGAIFHELVLVALDGGDPLAAVAPALEVVPPAHRDPWATVLAPTWTPDQATEVDGAVWPTLGSAVWALRVSSSFTDAMCRVGPWGSHCDRHGAGAGRTQSTATISNPPQGTEIIAAAAASVFCSAADGPPPSARTDDDRHP